MRRVTDAKAVEAAMDEFDRLGREAFLAKYGFGTANRYYVRRAGRLYDSKAIYGAAHQYQYPEDGPKISSSFSGGQQAVQEPLEALGYEFEVLEADVDDLSALVANHSITGADVALIAASRSKKKYVDLSDQERSAYARVSAALYELGQLVVATLANPADYEVRTTAGFNTKSGVRGGLPKDLWFSVCPKANIRDLAGMPQLFLIVSERGIEFGFGASVSPNDFSNAEAKQSVRAAASTIFRRLPFPNSTEASELRQKLELGKPWYYRKKHRLDPNQSDFESLDDWLGYLRSDDGVKNAAGTISRYVLPDEVDETSLDREIYKMAYLFQPLIARAWYPELDPSNGLVDNPDARGPEVADVMPKVRDSKENARQSAIPRFWVEKCLVEGRVDRQTGPHRLGQALWSPQKDKAGRQAYSSMLSVAPGDIVLHLTDNRGFTGISEVDGIADDTFTGIDGTRWAGMPSYRVQLRNFRPLEPELLRDKFLAENEVGSALRQLLGRSDSAQLFYSRDLKLNQGAYLTEAPIELVNLLNRAYRNSTGRLLFEMSGLPEPAPTSHNAASRFTLDDAVKELFLERDVVQRYLETWRSKKNLILTGAPGGGKSYVARRLAYALIGLKDNNRVRTVQFHQSYSYEDFVQGYRPNGSQGFERKNGAFFEFRDKAVGDPDGLYVFIIDEINRGNLSKILGELMLLIEPDKRGPTWRTRLAYAAEDEEDFYVPENMFILGMMNTADRSLSLVDYALRRRFAFVGMEPLFGAPNFRAHLEMHGVPDEVINKIVSGMGELNQAIEADRTNLGPGFRIGHSFFTPTEPVSNPEQWFRRIIETEIHPLLEEYWFDAPETSDHWRDRLLR